MREIGIVLMIIHHGQIAQELFHGKHCCGKKAGK